MRLRLAAIVLTASPDGVTTVVSEAALGDRGRAHADPMIS